MNELIKRYNVLIYKRFKDLLKSKKSKDLNNNDICKIFEYYICIKLSQEHNTTFYEFSDIDPDFKEQNQLSKNDTGIDCCNLIDTIVQCKLRKDNLSWGECSTFFGSQNIFDEKINEPIIRWKKLIIARNNDSNLARNLRFKKQLFIDKTYDKKEIIKYCENLVASPPTIANKNDLCEVRDYQKECIDLIMKNKENLIISLPTGTGKNFIIVNSLLKDKKYLILVPRIILMEQIQAEIIKHNSDFEEDIQLIGDGNNKYDKNIDITICVYNSVKLIEKYFEKFHTIFVDEAHHIDKPEIYEDIYDKDCENSENSEDCDSDEESSKNNYIDTIHSLTKYKNNVYLSATIDRKEGFKYYSKDIREMIDRKYLCDYTINIPVFTEDPTNKNICEYLLKEHRNIIVYCDSQKEGNNINNLLNSLQKKSSEYIDCNTPRSKRENIIKKYKNGDIQFLVNVRILVEGFNSPITKGICMMHIPSSSTTLIQIIGRALRLHPEKTYAKIILPFSSENDGKNINEFMRVMAKNDSRIKTSYKEKKIGGYISIEEGEKLDEEEGKYEDLCKKIEMKYEMIYDSMGELKNRDEIWMNNFNEIKIFIDKNNRRPSSESDDINESKIGKWICTQTKNYKKNEYSMRNITIRKEWEKFINHKDYQIYFTSNIDKWKMQFEELKTYLDNNKKSIYSDNEKNIYVCKLEKWLDHQKENYKKKNKSMKNLEIYNTWTEFINSDKYMKYFMSNYETWIYNLDKLKKYIDENKKRPSAREKNDDISKLGSWTMYNMSNYKRKKNVMCDPRIYLKWKDFINCDKYKKYFVSNEDVWIEQLNILKKYIDENNKTPSRNDKNIVVRNLGKWTSVQRQNYKFIKKIMKDTKIYNMWGDFVNDKKYSKFMIKNIQNL